MLMLFLLDWQGRVLLLRVPGLLLQAEGYYVARGLSFRYLPAVASLRVLMLCTLPWICL